MSHRWRHDDEDTRVASVLHYETLGYHRGYRGFSETYHVSNETTIMPDHGLITLYDCIALVTKVAKTIPCWVKFEVILNHATESVNQHFHIKFVWSWRLFSGEVCGTTGTLHIFYAYGNTFFPQQPEFILAVFHVFIIFHRHIQFVSVVIAGSEPLVGKVAAAHDDPAVAMF